MHMFATPCFVGFERRVSPPNSSRPGLTSRIFRLNTPKEKPVQIQALDLPSCTTLDYHLEEPLAKMASSAPEKIHGVATHTDPPTTETPPNIPFDTTIGPESGDPVREQSTSNLQEDRRSHGRDPPGVIEQALLTTPIPDDAQAIPDHEVKGINPHVLVGKRLVNWEYYDGTLAHLTLNFSDRASFVIMHQNATSWDSEDSGDEPELEIDGTLKNALEPLEVRNPIPSDIGVVVRHRQPEAPPFPVPMIIAAVAMEKTSRGWDPMAGPHLDCGAPCNQKHQILGLRLEGMEKMGWIMSKVDIWDTDLEMPGEITWYDVVVAEEVGRSPTEDPY